MQTEVLPLELFSVSGYVTIGKSANKILKILAFNNFLNKHLEIMKNTFHSQKPGQLLVKTNLLSYWPTPGYK